MKPHLIATLTLLSIITTGTLAQNSPKWFERELDAVDKGGYVHYSYTSICLDSQGFIHISYRGADYSLKYATNKGGMWSTETVFKGRRRVARESSLALDRSSRPHISFSFSDGSDEDLMYAKQTSRRNWTTITVDTTLSSGMENDIAIDSKGAAHISHWDWNKNDLRYSTNKSGSWETVTLDSGLYWAKTAIALDSQDNVHIAYRRDDGLVHYSRGTIQIIDSNLRDSGNPDLAVDLAGRIHILYSSYGNLMYGFKNQGKWRFSRIGLTKQWSRNHSLSLDAQYKPHVAYRNQAGNLVYARRIKGKWRRQLIDGFSNTGYSNSISVSKEGAVRISYRHHNIPEVNLSDIWSSPSSFAVAVGEGGTIIFYNGKSWDLMHSGTKKDLLAVWGSSETDVFAAGRGMTILHFDGRRWETLPSTPNQLGDIHCIWGDTKGNIYFGGSLGLILHFDGNSWNEMETDTTDTITGIWGTSASQLFAVSSGFGSGNILQYDSRSWKIALRDLPRMRDIWGSSPSNVYAVGLSREIYRFNGRRWATIETNLESGYVSVWGSSHWNIFFLSERGKIVSRRGPVWYEADLPKARRYYSIAGGSRSDVLVAGDSAIFRSGEEEWRSDRAATIHVISNKGLLHPK